ncbi:MAG: ankyrin repeat domain-containing protein [Elusimicrobia bacterium]|nr:ankyrin repeat domain-containing protein [Elusimicrobiota bacterium]
MKKIFGTLILAGIACGCASPLHKAARVGDIPAMKTLLAGKANLKARSDHKTALHDAVTNGQVEAARLLIDSGADINEQAYFRCTPLHFAASYGHVGMVQFLLQKGANPEPGTAYYCGLPQTVSFSPLSTPEQLTPLEMAERRGNQTSVDLIRAAINNRLGIASGSVKNADEYGPIITSLIKAYQGGGKTIAVAGFSYADGRLSEDGNIVSERFTTELINRGALRVVERKQIEKVLGELKLQNAGSIGPESAKKVGHMLGADLLVIGGMVELQGKILELNIRLASVESGEAVAAVTGQVRKDWVGN